MEMEPGQETTSTDKEPTYEAVLEILSHVKNLRGLGHQLHIPTGDLNALDQYSGFEERRERFFNRWRDLHHNFSWAALREALLAPQFEEYGLVEKITKRLQDHSLTDRGIRKQSSADSAISVSSPTSPLTMERPYSQSSATVAVSQQSGHCLLRCGCYPLVKLTPNIDPLIKWKETLKIILPGGVIVKSVVLEKLVLFSDQSF